MLTGLQEDYRSIDSSTALAIISDYDICDPAQLSDVRQILDTIKEAVPFGEATGFDASGASGSTTQSGALDAGGEDESISGSGKSLPCWKSETDDTSTGLSMSVSDLQISEAHTDAPTNRDESPNRSYTSALDDLDDKSKEKALLGIFPILTEFDIIYTLKKYKGDASLAIDELMTQSFLQENGSRHKGIDAFSESDIATQAPRSKRQKRKKKRRVAAEATGSQEETVTRSKWDTAKQDIEFIASKTEMPEQQVSSLYHKNGGSAKATISAIIEACREIYSETDDSVVHVEAYNLKREFPSVNLSDLETLIHLTSISLPNAHALARRLAISSPLTKPKPTIQLEFRHAPIQFHEPSPTTPTSAIEVHTLSTDLSSAATSYTASRNANFDKAATYYRKGKSDPLMAGAAAYYAEAGRNYNGLAKAASSAAADELVARQSDAGQLDLHGVNVKDALRISRERVTNWWHEKQKIEGRGGNRGVGGYRIITGVGHHSEGGRGKLGPAVGKMLIREGWKVEVGSGVLVVRGVVVKR